MHINELNFYQNTTSFEEFRENDSTKYESSFPLFNISALKDSELNFSDYNYIFDAEKISEIVEEITTKKSKTNNGTELVIKKRGRKAVNKNGKSWDDPTITMREIIENDLAGEATVSELKAKEERLRKMREAKALKRQRRLNGDSTEVSDNGQNNEKIIEINLDSAEQNVGPQIIFKDGKIVVDNSYLTGQTENSNMLVMADNGKKKKLNSMSFRTKNYTAKWTEEETKKFYKAIEIFGADFDMIAKLFQTRNRDQIKNKYNKESKTNGKLLDEAFKKNSLLCKRSIMERIKLFNENVKNLDGNLDLEMTTLQKTTSNSSTDSLDLTVLNEIQEIFVKEMRSEKQKNNVNTLNMFNGNAITFAEDFLNVTNNNNNTVNNNNNEENNNKETVVVTNQKKNLLLGF